MVTDGRRVRRGAVPLLAAASCALAASAAASSMQVAFDDRAADLLTRLFERKVDDEHQIGEIVRTRGYQLLFRQIAAQTRPARDVYEVETWFRNGLALLRRGIPSSIGMRAVQVHPDRYREAIREFRSVSGTTRWRIAERLNSLLPAGTDFTATAYLVIGGGAAGFAFADRNDLAIRLDDFVVFEGPEAIELDRFASVLCHELYHVGFQSAGGLPPRPDPPDDDWTDLARRWGPNVVGEVWRASELEDWDIRALERKLRTWVPSRRWNLAVLNFTIGVLSRLQNEGSAVFAEEAMWDLTGEGRFALEIEERMEATPSDFALFARLIRLLTEAGTGEEAAELADEGFLLSGPFYRVGRHMAKRIDEVSGRDRYIDTVVGGPLEFFDAYFRTRPPSGPTEIDPATRSEIELLIREIRGVASR